MLTPDNVRYENGVKICEKIIPDNARATKYVASYVPMGGKMKPCVAMKPIGVTIHNTGDLKNVNDDAEQYTRATWPNCNMGGVVVHYYVDDIGAWQNLRENEAGWHASDGDGDGNRRTIAIECIMSGTTGVENLKARDNAARLIASILDRYNWTIDNLYTHNHWKGKPDKIVNDGKKNCPIYLLPNYDDFKELIKSYMKKNEVSNPNTGADSNDEITYEDIEVGDIFEFVGDKQYVAANIVKGVKANPGKIKVTKKYLKNSKHPILARSIDDSGKFILGVYGWIDIKDLKPEVKLPYLVRIIADRLNIRSGPGDEYNIVGSIKDKGIYTIIEQKNGYGRLKSKVGWISLSYTKKL